MWMMQASLVLSGKTAEVSHWYREWIPFIRKKDRDIQKDVYKRQLEEFLKNHPEIKEIEICTDNDFAGRWAKEQMKKHYEGTYQIICNLPEKEGEDYADLAKEKKQANKCRDRPLAVSYTHLTDVYNYCNRSSWHLVSRKNKKISSKGMSATAGVLWLANK